METISLCVPTRGRVYHGTAQVLSPYNPLYVKSRFSVVDARNRCRAECLKQETDVLVMVDDDVVPSPMLFDEGLEPILSGNIDILVFPCPLVQSSGKVLPNLYKIIEGDSGSMHPKIGYSLNGHVEAIVDIDAGGFGCVAITRKALEKIGPFAPRVDPEDFSLVMGEDIDYCLRAKNLDLTVKASMEYFCDHMMELSGSSIALSFAEMLNA